MGKRSGRNQREGNSLRWSSAFKILLLLIVIAGITMVGIAVAYAVTAISQSPAIDPKNIRSAISETSVVRDKNGDNVEQLVQNEFSEWVPIKRMPDYLLDAAVAIEDQRISAAWFRPPCAISKAWTSVKGAPPLPCRWQKTCTPRR